MDQLKTLISDLQAKYAALTGRERRLVSIAGGAVVCFILFIMIFSFSSSAAGTRRRTEEKLTKLRDVQVLATSFREAESQRQAAERQLSASNIRLLSYLEEKATAAGLETPTMNPKGDVNVDREGKIVESSVELTLTDISLRQLHEFLQTVESGPGVVKVKYLRVEPKPANETLTAWTTVATYRLKQ